MKRFKTYLIVWILLVILFNLCYFVTPSVTNGISKYSGGFWPCYGLVMLAFVLHLVFAYKVFSEKNREKQLQNTSVTVISFFELALMFIIGAICVLVPAIPYWVGVIACYVVLAFSIIFLLSAKTVGENAVAANKALNAKTSFMRELTDNAQGLIGLAKTEEARSLVTKVYEAIRYSDTVSSEELLAEETAISDGLDALKGLLKSETDFEALKDKTNKLLLQIEQRNNRCKALKRKI